MNLQNQSRNPHAFQNVTQNEKSMAMLLWILNILSGFVGPLIIWLIKKTNQLSLINKVRIT